MNKITDLIYGFKPVIELLDGPRSVNRILVDKNFGQDKMKLLGQVATKNEVAIQRVPKQKLDRLTRNNHQGVIAFASPINYTELSTLVQMSYEHGRDPLFIILDGVTDVRNLGAVARTAYGFGLDGIIVPATGAALVNSDAVKTSAGALENIPVCKVPSLEEALEYLKNSGVNLAGITERGKDTIYAAEVEGPLAIIMGSEDTGISKKVLQACDQELGIPISGSVGSLNVSVAAGIVIAEIARKRGLNV